MGQALLRNSRAQSRSTEIWQGMVDYANGDLQDKKALKSALASVQSLLRGCMFPQGLAQDWVDLLSDCFKEIGKIPSVSPKTVFQKKVMLYQNDLRQLLGWLCDPKRQIKIWDLSPAEYLTQNADGVHREVSVDECDFDDAASPVFVVLNRYKTIMDPICDFLVREVEVRRDVPVGICQGPDCDKFMFLKTRGRKRFCSDGCRTRNFQKQPEKWNGYMRMYRVESWLEELLEMKPSQLNKELGKDPSRLKNRLERAEKKFEGDKEIRRQIVAVYKRASS